MHSIRNLRQDLHLSDSYMAKSLGISLTTYQHLECTNSIPEMLEPLLLKLLHLRKDDLYSTAPANPLEELHAFKKKLGQQTRT